MLAVHMFSEKWIGSHNMVGLNSGDTNLEFPSPGDGCSFIPQKKMIKKLQAFRRSAAHSATKQTGKTHKILK
jgi:hypothetical protein